MAVTGTQTARGSWYRYRAARYDGRVVKGRVWADSAEQAKRAVGANELYVISVAVAEGRGTVFGRPSRRDLAVVFRSVASLVASGLPLERALSVTEPLATGKLVELLQDARRRLTEGAALADALGGQTIIPAHIIGMLRAGERGSRLDAALDASAAQLEREADLRSRLRSALAYPVLIGVTGLLSIGVIGTVIVPRFAALLLDMGQELPAPTRVLLVTASWLQAAILPLLLGAVVVVAAMLAWLETAHGRYVFHRCLGALPIVGSIRLAFSTSRLCRALSGMLDAGMPLLGALSAARDASGDAVISMRLERARERVARGQRLTRSLEAEGTLSPDAVRLVAVGESGGELGVMFGRAADLAEQDGERRMRTVVALLEPGLVVLLGGLVAAVAAALLQAVYALRPGAIG